MEQLAETDFKTDCHPSPEAVVPDALLCRPGYGDCEGPLGGLFSHTIMTLEAHCSTLVVEPSFLHRLSSK